MRKRERERDGEGGKERERERERERESEREGFVHSERLGRDPTVEFECFVPSNV